MDVQFHNLKGLTYKEVWDFQTLLHKDVKLAKKQISSLTYDSKVKANFLNHMVFCEHLPVFTIGKSGSIKNLKTSENLLKESKIELFKINRGGDITFHGPGQLTGYLIFDLETLYRDVHLYVRNIEECIIQLLKTYNLEAFRLNNFTGVWLGDDKDLRKICAIGVHLSRWVTMHGFGLNVNTDLDYFKHITPCGIEDTNKTVTSLSNELDKKIELEELTHRLIDITKNVFGFNIIEM